MANVLRRTPFGRPQGSALNQVSGVGGRVDRPLGSWKGYSTVVVPHLNWRGLFGKGTDANGNASTAEIEWEIRQSGGTVRHAPEPTRSGVMNERHVNICRGPGPCPFSGPQPNPVPESGRVQ